MSALQGCIRFLIIWSLGDHGIYLPLSSHIVILFPDVTSPGVLTVHVPDQVRPACEGSTESRPKTCHAVDQQAFLIYVINMNNMFVETGSWSVRRRHVDVDCMVQVVTKTKLVY